MNKQILSLAFGAVLLALSLPVEAQQANRVYRVGFLSTGAANASEPQAVLRGLRELGYVDGQNIIVEQSDKAAELVRLKVDVIVVFGTSAALAAKKATSTVPIVMTSSADPVGSGLVASLARPGGNLTGLTSVSAELGENAWSYSRKSFRGSRAWLSRHQHGVQVWRGREAMSPASRV